MLQKKIFDKYKKKGEITMKCLCIDYRCKYPGANNIYIYIIINML